MLKRAYSWIILSILLQIVILSYFNFHYLESGGPVKATVYQPEKAVTDTSIKLPDGVSGIKTSVSGLFSAYMLGNKLEIFDVRNRKQYKTIDPGTGSVTFYRWLPDRDMLIYSMNTEEKGKPVIKVTTYDAQSGYEQTYPSPQKLPDASKVDNIVLSPMTNIVYVKINTSPTEARILSYNIMDELKSIMTTATDTVIYETLYSDNLVYQDSKYRIYYRNGKNGSVKQLAFKGRMVLLGTDSEDKVYTGELNTDNKVVAIYYGKLDGNISKDWRKLELKSPAEPENIVVTSDSGVYQLNSAEKVLTGLDLDRTIKYKEDFVEITGGFVVTRDGRRLVLTLIKPGQ